MECENELKSHSHLTLKRLIPFTRSIALGNGTTGLICYIFLSFPPVFNTARDVIHTCAAEENCQRFDQQKDLLNGNCRIMVECESCMQWYHGECVLYDLKDMTLDSDVDFLCDCHLEDVRGSLR